MLSIGNRVGQLAAVRLTGELQHPARHRHGNTVSGKVLDERVAHFPRI